MKWVESAGLVKVDFLGLKTLTVLDRAVSIWRSAGRRSICLAPAGRPARLRDHGAGPDAWRVPAGKTGHARHPAQVEAASLEEITALISLYRPGSDGQHSGLLWTASPAASR